MTIQEAFVISNHGWSEDDKTSKILYGQAVKVLKHEYQKLYLQEEKEILERLLKQKEQELQKHTIPF
jgi:hypothetical protein